MNTKPNLRIALVQCPIIANSPEANLEYVVHCIERYAHEADLFVLPETITTGFSPEASNFVSAWGYGHTFDTLQALSQRFGIGLCGSYLAKDGERRSNRFFLFDKDEEAQWQDKRHLFSLGGEPAMIEASSERHILSFRGWRILPTICYDLRFPVWCRCVDNEYDILITVANWPKARREVWSTLLKARAMENLAYVIGVNRIGVDSTGLIYSGDSALISPRGKYIAQCHEEESIVFGTIESSSQEELRSKFPVWQDADTFTLNI